MDFWITFALGVMMFICGSASGAAYGRKQAGEEMYEIARLIHEATLRGAKIDFVEDDDDGIS